MQYRDYLFPHNPRSITVTQGAHTVSLLCPGRGEVRQHLGGGGRVVRCSGSFFGGTYAETGAQVEEFRRKCCREDAGTLFLPGVPPFAAHLREFVFEAVGDGRIVPYTMTFVEAEAAV